MTRIDSIQNTQSNIYQQQYQQKPPRVNQQAQLCESKLKEIFTKEIKDNNISGVVYYYNTIKKRIQEDTLSDDFKRYIRKNINPFLFRHGLYPL